MPTCVGCSCERAEQLGQGERILLSTGVNHTLQALRSALRSSGNEFAEPIPGLLAAESADPAGLFTAVRQSLSSVEAAEVRALVVNGQVGDELLACAISAPTLAQVEARVAHADLLPLFADEARAFRSVYQPIVSLGSDATLPIGQAGGPALIAYEALLRASGPAGPIMPLDLFEAAEAAGWLHVLDRIGRTTALRGAAGWLGDARLFVNFLPTTIYRPEVCLATTERAAARAGIRMDQIVFEVTESERITDLDHLSDVFTYYRDRGCKVALDDLGAGYSSLNVLVRLKPDVVKLDKDIVQHLPDPASSAVVSAVVEITHAYGGLVLAECVETAEQAQAARDLGVDLGQGWYFGRPEEAPQRPAEPAEPARATRDPFTAAPPTTAARASGNDPAVALSERTPARDAAASAPSDTPSDMPGDDVPGDVPGPTDVEALLTQALALTNTAVTIADASSPDLPLIYVNDAFEQVTGYSASEVIGVNCRFLQCPETGANVLREVRDAIAAGRDFSGVLRNRRKNGELWWNELRMSAVHDANGRLTHYFGFQNNVTARIEAEENVKHLAMHDHLTGLPNRRYIFEVLRQALIAAQRDGTQVAVLFVDLDGFKEVNDRLGHSAGDLALIATATRLRGALRDGDLVGRQSGDEFLAVLTGVHPHLAQTIAERAANTVRDSFQSPLDVAEATITLSASIGIACFPEHGNTAEDLVHAADQAMYAAKAGARGRIAFAGKVLTPRTT